MNIQAIRNDIVNYGDKIFLNSAGSSLMPKSVRQVIDQYLVEEESYGGYKLADMRAKDLDQLYHEAALLLNCSCDNIAFAHDATDAYIKALSSIPFQKGDIIITSQDDYASNQIQFISLQQRFGIQIKRIRTLDNGDIDLDHFEDLISEKQPTLVAITHIPTNSGKIQDVEAIGEICHQHDILYLVDACQSVGQIQVDVKKIRCDFLSMTGRKFLRGPRGTGLLYVSDKVLERQFTPLFIDGYGAKWTKNEHFEIRDSAKRFQTWEAPFALIIGLTEALRYANQIGMVNIQARNAELMTHFRSRLGDIPQLHVFDNGSQLANITTIQKNDKSLLETEAYLQKHQVFYSVSTLEWGLIDFTQKGVEWVIRLSPHYFNTMEELDKTCRLLAEL